MQSLFFLVKFLVIVCVLLIGYRYAINSGPNIRYLYVIASQTETLLGLFGHSSEIEPHRRQVPPGRARAQLAEWGVGAQDDSSGIHPPLTPWEYWLYSAHQEIQLGKSIADHGPTVRFVWRQSLTTQRLESAQELHLLLQSNAAEAEIQIVQDRIKALDDKIALDPSNPKTQHDRAFDFRIVPDCGAIPSFAIYFAAVIAFPVSVRKRLVGIIAGLSLLYIVNIARLVFLGFLGAFDSTPDRRWFTFIHEYIWQSIFLLFVVVVWLLWIEFIVRNRERVQP